MKYFDKNGDHIKTGPMNYKQLTQDEILTCITDLTKKRFNREERLSLEIKVMVNQLTVNERAIIDGLPFNGIDIQHYRDGRVQNTAIFGQYRIKCSVNVVKYADNIIETNRNV